MGLFDKITTGIKKAWNTVTTGVKNGYEKVKNFFSKKNAPEIVEDPWKEKYEKLQQEIKEQRRREQELEEQRQYEYEMQQRKIDEDIRRREEAEARRERNRIREENERKRQLEMRASMIDEYQEKVAVRAGEYETMVRQQYSLTYVSILTELERYMDVRPIRSKIDEYGHSFKNKMRDEVNSKICLSNYELTRLMNNLDLPFKDYCAQINEYSDKIYYSARQNLLTITKKTIEETNSFITVYANKYMKDTQEKEQEHKENLRKLSKVGNERDEQLLKSSIEYSTLQFIKELANQKVE